MTQPVAADITVIDAPLGRLAVRTTDSALIRIDHVDNRASLIKPKTPLAREVVRQLQSYFSDPAFAFDLPLQFAGSAHQQKVLKTLCGIRSGDTMTYGGVAARIMSGARAVGNGCRRNPISIVIPCHRVVAANGIGGYGGHVNGGVLNKKHWLLRHEGLKISS